MGFEKLFWFLKLTCVLGNHFVFLEIDLIINVKLDKSVKKKNKFKLNIQTQKSNIMGSNQIAPHLANTLYNNSHGLKYSMVQHQKNTIIYLDKCHSACDMHASCASIS